MPPVVFEPTISVGEQPQTYALDRAATVVSGGLRYIIIYLPLICGRTMRKKISECGGKNFSVVLLHFVIVGLISEEHSKHIFQAVFSCFTRKIKLCTLLLFMCVCVFMFTLPQS